MIPILRIEDVDVALNWYELLGFSARRSVAGLPEFVEIARGDVCLFLAQDEEGALPDASIYLRVRDVGAVAAAFGMSPEDTPWGQEIELRDPDGNRIRIVTPHE